MSPAAPLDFLQLGSAPPAPQGALGHAPRAGSHAPFSLHGLTRPRSGGAWSPQLLPLYYLAPAQLTAGPVFTPPLAQALIPNPYQPM